MATEPESLKRAELREVVFDQEGSIVPSEGDERPSVSVQFNPETLKVAYELKKANDDQDNGSAVQFTGPGSTKLTVDLVFDTTVDPPRPSPELLEGDPDAPGEDESGPISDVRVLTRAVNYFIRAKENSNDGNRYSPPGVAFIWGSFFFAGVMDSMNEKLEFFSAEGRPLRASVTISITQQKVDPEIRDGQGGAGTGGLRSRTPDLDAFAQQSTPQAEARQGETAQDIAARETGDPRNWRDFAEANDIDNPRNLAPGTRLMPPLALTSGGSVRLGASAPVGTNAAFGAGASLEADVASGGGASLTLE